MRRILLTLFLSLAVAGCLGVPTDDATPAARESVAGTAYLGADGNLLDAPPEADAVAVAWSYQDWAQGVIAPEWTSKPFGQDAVMDGINVTLTYRAEATTVAATQASRPQFTMWFGAGPVGETPGIIEHGFVEAPMVWMAGDEQTVTFPVDLPRGGFAVEQDWVLTLRVATYFPDHDGQVSVVLGDSRIDWTGATYAQPAAAPGEPVAFTGSALGGRCIAPLNIEESAVATYGIDVPADATAISVQLERTGGNGAGPDLDMFLRDADGDVVIYAAGSSTPEALRARLPNLAASAAGEWTLTVYNCQPQASEFEATVTIQ